MNDPLLLKAWNLYLRSRFRDAISFLEPMILNYRTDPEFYRILGVCCLRAGDWKGGETYLARSLQLEPEDRVPVLLALMVVAGKKKDLTGAVRFALEALDVNPRCQPAKKALRQFRAALLLPEGSSAVAVADLVRYLPKVHPDWARWGKPALAALAVAAMLIAVYFAVSSVTFPDLLPVSAPPATGSRVGPSAEAALPASPVVKSNTSGAPVALVLTAEQVRSTQVKIQKLFQDYADSACRLEINRLLLSNASQEVQERARALIPYLHAPDFSRPEASVDYQEVRSFPELYEGCTVLWKGVVSNLDSGAEEIRFDLLLGYENGQVLEGVIPVRLGFASLLKNSQVLEVLGQVERAEGLWWIKGAGVHVLSYRAP